MPFVREMMWKDRFCCAKAEDASCCWRSSCRPCTPDWACWCWQDHSPSDVDVGDDSVRTAIPACYEPPRWLHPWHNSRNNPLPSTSCSEKLDGSVSTWRCTRLDWWYSSRKTAHLYNIQSFLELVAQFFITSVQYQPIFKMKSFCVTNELCWLLSRSFPSASSKTI